MRETLWTLAALISHWRRRQGNLATLVLGLAIATALWSGVQALNAQARNSYDAAANAISGGGARTLVAARGGLFDQELFVRLRRAGVTVSPVLEGAVRIGEKNIRIIGVEPLSLPRRSPIADRRTRSDVIEEFFSGPGRSFVAPQTLRRLDLAEGAQPQTERGQQLPPLAALAEAPPGAIIVDIGVAQRLLDRPGKLSRLVILDEETFDEARLKPIAGDALRLVAPDDDSDLARLTDSFHLNLTAFGFLAFLVGLFIVHAAYGLAFEQRLPTLRTLRALGVGPPHLIAAMAFEIGALTLIAGGAGVLGGHAIAQALLPDVAKSLESLYGAQISDRLALDARWWLSGLAMAGAGAALAAASGLTKALRLPALSFARPMAWRGAHHRYLRRQATLAALALVTAAGAYGFGEGLASGFAIIGLALLAAALILPVGLTGVLALGERFARRPLARWFFADGRQEISGLSLALMALLIALATNIGVGGMVEGFRQTFDRWLDARLVAEVYFEAATPADARDIEAWARTQPDIAAILPVWRAKTRIGGWPVDVVGMTPHETYTAHFPLIDAPTDVWTALHAQDAVLVSEQLARRLSLAIGETLDIPTSGRDWPARIVGVFPDYGNPKGQLRIDHEKLKRYFDDASGVQYSLRVDPAATKRVIENMQQRFGGKIARIVDQAEVKTLSTDIFERTFAVTTALNTLTLIVSGVALFASLLTLSDMRRARIAPIWALGATRRKLAALEMARVMAFAAGAAAFAIPLGLFMTWCLVAIVNVAAFGWRLPFHMFPAQWLVVSCIAFGAAFFAALIPVVRLARVSPTELLRVFSNER
ncbi:ABC transporter permease [Methylocystis sp. SB2]|uniref:ABC transporter permease n=1 Tax=Methylocystis sp. (strain SB2) TaxID=743836 RepID=UPI00040BF13B|nr:ABC transporter permease [Methylocystis sp. SB2]ULO22859.1 ABC transporter permease [Methylocystis sp. SB2]